MSAKTRELGKVETKFVVTVEKQILSGN